MPTGVSLEIREGSAVLSVEGRTNLNLLGRKVFESLSRMDRPVLRRPRGTCNRVAGIGGAGLLRRCVTSMR